VCVIICIDAVVSVSQAAADFWSHDSAAFMYVMFWVMISQIWLSSFPVFLLSLIVVLMPFATVFTLSFRKFDLDN